MGKRAEPERIVRLLRDAEAELAGGKTVAQVAQKLGVSEQTFYRWRQRYGGMQVEEAKRLRELEVTGCRASPSTCCAWACAPGRRAPRRSTWTTR